jgi:hypothetical protein
VRTLRPKLWWQKNWLLHHNAPSHTFFFTMEFFYQKQHDCHPPPTQLFCFHDWRQNWKAAILTQLRWSRQNRKQCWTPSQNMTSRMHLKSGRSAGNCAYARKGTTSRVMVANRPKVSFWPDGSTSPRNYGWIFVGKFVLWRSVVKH